jgi:hypothetical protein
MGSVEINIPEELYAAFADGWKPLRITDQVPAYYAMRKQLDEMRQIPPPSIYIKKGEYNFYILTKDFYRRIYIQLGDGLYHDVQKIIRASAPVPQSALPTTDLGYSGGKTINGTKTHKKKRKNKNNKKSRRV